MHSLYQNARRDVCANVNQESSGVTAWARKHSSLQDNTCSEKCWVDRSDEQYDLVLRTLPDRERQPSTRRARRHKFNSDRDSSQRSRWARGGDIAEARGHYQREDGYDAGNNDVGCGLPDSPSRVCREPKGRCSTDYRHPEKDDASKD